MKNMHYEIHIRFIVSPEQVVGETVIPQRAFYHAIVTKGPFNQSKDAQEFLQKQWRSAVIMQWPTPDSEPLELVPSGAALQALLSSVKDAIELDIERPAEKCEEIDPDVYADVPDGMGQHPSEIPFTEDQRG